MQIWIYNPRAGFGRIRMLFTITSQNVLVFGRICFWHFFQGIWLLLVSQGKRDITIYKHSSHVLFSLNIHGKNKPFKLKSWSSTYLDKKNVTLSLLIQKVLCPRIEHLIPKATIYIEITKITFVGFGWMRIVFFVTLIRKLMLNKLWLDDFIFLSKSRLKVFL